MVRTLPMERRTTKRKDRMSAKVTKAPEGSPFKYLAWCDECQDGYQSRHGSIAAQNWAAIHEELRHMPPIRRSK